MLASAIEPAPPKNVCTGGRERRRAPRFERHSAAQLIYWPASTRTAALDVELLDYSRTGVGVLHDEAIRIGQKFVLCEPFVTRDSTCLYTVVRCDPRPDGRFTVGLQVSELPAEGSPEPSSGPSHKRAIACVILAVAGAVAVLVMAVLNR